MVGDLALSEEEDRYIPGGKRWTREEIEAFDEAYLASRSLPPKPYRVEIVGTGRRFVTLGECAEYLRVSSSTVSAWLADGQLHGDIRLRRL